MADRDAEFKLLTDAVEELGQQGAQAEGRLLVGASRLVCNSCRGAVDQARALLPGVDIQIVEDRLFLQLGGATPRIDPLRPVPNEDRSIGAPGLDPSRSNPGGLQLQLRW